MLKANAFPMSMISDDMASRKAGGVPRAETPGSIWSNFTDSLLGLGGEARHQACLYIGARLDHNHALNRICQKTGLGLMRHAISEEIALRVMEKEPVAVVIIDGDNYGAEGLAICRLLRCQERRNGRKAVPVFYAGASVPATVMDQIGQAGITGILLKPFDPERLPGRLRDALRRSVMPACPDLVDCADAAAFRAA